MAAVTGDMDLAVSGGATYNWMIVEKNGQKLWNYEPLFTQPPSMIEGRITCTILAAPKMRQGDGTVIATRTIATLLTELAACNAEKTNNLTIQGHDGATYTAFMSGNPYRVRAIYDPSGRIEQFEIDLEFIEQHT